MQNFSYVYPRLRSKSIKNDGNLSVIIH